MAERKSTRKPRKASEKKVMAPETSTMASQFRLVTAMNDTVVAGQTHLIRRGAIVNPPPGPGRDRTKPDRDRFRDKIKKGVKDRLKDIVKNNPIFGDKGKVRIPVDGGKEPRWRPGRDGTGGQGRGRKGGDQEGEIIYLDITYEEFIQMLFEDLELPFLEKRDKSQMLVKTHKMRGMQHTGPDVRIDWEATEEARMERALALKYANPEDFADLEDDEIPDLIRVPYIPEFDYRYRRIEERWEPDSKAVAFLMLDRSGSMGGDPLAIAKFYFLLNILFLRTKYKTVEIVMIAHDSMPHRIMDEREFYQIEVDGGTMFVSSYDMIWEIAEREFPASTWNRYCFQATDGYMFDGEDEVTAAVQKLIRGKFNYFGYLEIDPYAGRWGWGWGRSWAPGGMALLAVAPDVKPHVGMSRVSSMDEVVDAFKEILNKDKAKDA